jgi:hypothetical protein
MSEVLEKTEPNLGQPTFRQCGTRSKLRDEVRVASEVKEQPVAPRPLRLAQTDE